MCALIDAYKRDPRILKRKEQERVEKQRKKQAKYSAKKLREEEAARAAEEERPRKQEEEKKAAEAVLHQKKVKEREKKLLRKERSRLRILATPFLSQHLLDLSEDDVESLCMSLDMGQLRYLCDKIDGRPREEQGKLLKNALRHHSNSEARTISQKKIPQQNDSVDTNGNIPVPESSSAAKEDDSKAASTGGLIHQPHITATAADSAASSALEKDTWSAVLERALVQALKAFPKDTPQRWERVAAAAPGKTINQCKKRFTSLKNFRNKKNAVQSGQQSDLVMPSGVSRTDSFEHRHSYSNIVDRR
ncbi:hypothetical protein Nepgr_012081 [Nepenthes gracilis]|uniref:Myb-like domain-containing protein n=1 Tax=Nepenthes gracilis TaxID=150966 RepID=A0AAD3SGA3_NEPGR|nr:hypothetical protein Nepgr_012081 [Nepenthes gracilis]